VAWQLLVFRTSADDAAARVAATAAALGFLDTLEREHDRLRRAARLRHYAVDSRHPPTVLAM
jgi:hypothetical protein